MGKLKSRARAVLRRVSRSGLRTPIYFYVNQDLKKSTEYIGYSTILVWDYRTETTI